MQQAILDFFHQYPQLAVLSSLLASVLVAVIGVLPSFFITAANILFFGFFNGIAISFAGEALGAIAAFYLYRLGFKKGATQVLQKHKGVQALLLADGARAFWLIVSLRLIPFVPSGLVTFAAAVGRVSALVFVIASSLGKLPALLLEGYAVYEVTNFGWQGKLILSVVAIVILILVIRQIKNKKGRNR